MTITIPANRTIALKAKNGGGFASEALLASPVVDNGNGTLTLTGSGFGTVGPEFAFNFDAANASGATLPNTEVVVGSGTVIEADALPVVDEPKLIGGKGLQIGSNGTDLGSTSYSRYRLTHTPTTRCFESRTVYFPLAHAQKASDYFAGVLADPHPGGSDANQDWQVKPVWNQADNDFVATDTDFFVRVFESRTGNGFRDDPVLASNSVTTVYMVPPLSRIARAPSHNSGKMPLDEPYTTEFCWDQGSLDSATDAEFEAEVYSSEYGQHTKGKFTGQDLVVTSGDYRQINSLTYPGYVRGFSIDLGTNLLETQIFRQVGPGAYCRLAICDNADYFQSKKRVLLPIQSGNWTDTAITADLPQWAPTLSAFTGWYVCAVGIDNTQIGTGVQI